MSHSITSLFADWVRNKPTAESYDYFRHAGCAFAQFLFDAGVSAEPSVYPHGWHDMAGGNRGSIPEAVEAALTSMPHTFGGLAARLASRLGRAL